MYQPEHFRVDDLKQMHALMRERPFAALVSAGSTGLYATHLPTVLKDSDPYGLIECHLARANPHWQDLASGNEALMIFQGPQGYITPNWYPSKAEHGKVVPTWNYAVVHVYGRPMVMENKDWLRRHVTNLNEKIIWSRPAAIPIAIRPPPWPIGRRAALPRVYIARSIYIGRYRHRCDDMISLTMEFGQSE